MKVVLPRAGALVIVVLLGWIAIANAQKNGSNSTDGDTTIPDATPSDSVNAPSSGNPLRNTAPSAGSATLPAAASADLPARSADNSIRRQIPDPFGLPARGGKTSAAGSSRGNAVSGVNPSRNSQTLLAAATPAGTTTGGPAQGFEDPSRNRRGVVPVASEQAIAGPELAASAQEQAGEDRYAGLSSETGQEDPRSFQSGADADHQEPARFTEDPHAVPTNNMRDRSAGPAFGDNGPAMNTANEMDGTGEPGGNQFEGVQSPQVEVKKLAPPEIQVGKPAIFRVALRNTGKIPAGNVEVRDQIPRRTRLIATEPQATRGDRGELVWTLGTLRPGEEVAVEMQVMPLAEGEVGSMATVHFGIDATARSKVTRPQLKLTVSAPKQVMINEQVKLSITVANTGTGTATGVVIEDHIPPELRHAVGDELLYEVGSLKPGERRTLDLPLVANRPGPTVNMLMVRGDGGLCQEEKQSIEVVAPQLNVAIEGGKRRYLERPATYQLSVSNPGTALAQDVELVAYLPPGLKFVKADNLGHYDQASRAVYWRLEGLAAKGTGSVKLETIPIEAGEQAIRVRSTAQKVPPVEKEQAVLIEGVASTLFFVATTANPIEINGQTTYEVHVLNQGTKASSNVQLSVQLPQGLQFVDSKGSPTQARSDGSGGVMFDTIPQIAPDQNAEQIFRIRVKGVRPGDLRTRFMLKTDEMESPVMKEESTRVYADE